MAIYGYTIPSVLTPSEPEWHKSKMSSLNGLSTYLRKPIFKKLFHLAGYSKLKQEKRAMYNASLRNKWDEESIRSSQEELLKRVREKAMAEPKERLRERRK